MRDLNSGKDAQIAAVIAVIARSAPDILLLTSLDYDHGQVALGLLADQLRDAGLDFPHLFSRPPNTGLPSGLDLDGDGRLGGPGDAQGYGRFNGQGGLAILSKYPALADQAADFSDLLWTDLPGATLPQMGGRPFPSLAAQSAQRLSTTSHWDVPIALPDGRQLRLLAYHASPPVFDGVEDRNGLRNQDETRFWTTYLDGWSPGSIPPPGANFVLLGDANLDPIDGDGRSQAMRDLLAHPALQDPKPHSHAGRMAGQDGVNTSHQGDPALDTADWPDAANDPGNLRVDYVLPSRDLTVTGSGVYWPEGEAGEVAARASHHRLVWVDLE